MTAPKAYQDMRDMTGWQRTSCIVADVLRGSDATGVLSSLTDPEGTRSGIAVVYTEWGLVESETPILREYLWRRGENDFHECEHYVPEES